MFEKLLRDQNLHRASIAVVLHEILDLGIYTAFIFALTTYGLSPFLFYLVWLFSLASGIIVGHWAVELHDKYDPLHKILAWELDDIE